jgi:hypothetical protein
MRLKRIYHNYNKWEDWQNGMYSTKNTDNDKNLIREARMLLSSSSGFCEVAEKMVDKWQYSSEQNLTDRSRNRRAWIGQASCCFGLGASEQLTKIAWRKLSQERQNVANNVAEFVIKNWEMKQTSQLNIW